jgi:hypothetical protein
MKHAMLALLVFTIVITGGLDRSFFLADDTPICLVVVPDDADFADLLTAAQVAEEIMDLAEGGCPFSLVRFSEEISKEDTTRYNLVLLGETGLEIEGDSIKITEGVYLYENPFNTKRDVLLVEDPQSLIELLHDL